MGMMNPAKFVREVRQEMRKVTWPTRQETLMSTFMVLLLVTITSLFFLAVDAFFGWGVRLILGIGG